MRRGILLLPWLALLPGCAGEPTQGLEAPLRVATSLPPHAWLIERIAGDAVAVETALGPGDSPETHQPSDAAVSRLISSRIYFRAGVPFEDAAWFEALASRVEVVDLASDRAPDPHRWLDPAELRAEAERIGTTLARLEPSNAADFRRRGREVEAQLSALQAELAAELAPYAGRSFLAFHPSWGHFATAFGLRQVAVESGGQSPADAEVTTLGREARRLGLPVLFVSPQDPERASRAFADSIGARVVEIDPLAVPLDENLRSFARLLVESFGA